VRRVLGAALALSALAAATSARAEETRYTVAIGNNAPPSAERGLAALRYADDDAIRYFDLFGRLRGRTWLLTELDANSKRRHLEAAQVARAPTLANLRLAVSAIAAQIQKDKARGASPVVFLTFSGHAALNDQGEYYLSLLDGELTRAVLYDEILEPLRDARVHLIVDSCHAAGVVGVRGAFDHELEGSRVQLKSAERDAWLARYTPARFPNLGVLVASTEGQEAHEWSQIEAGVFTYEVTSALLGAADVNGDLRIEYSEVAAFVARANQALENPTAVPELLARAPSGNSAVLLDLTQLTRSLVLTGDPGALGKFYVELSDGERWLGAHLPNGGRMVLALPLRAGSYLRSGEREAEIPLTSSRVVALESLRFVPGAVGTRGSVARALQQSLFAEPFGAAYYRQFVAGSELPEVHFGEPPRALPVLAVGSADRVARTNAAPAIAFGVGAGLSTAVALTSGALALHSYSEFKAEARQREATELQGDVTRYRNVALVAGALGVVAGVGAWLTWPVSQRSRVAAAGSSVEFVQRF